MKRRPAVKLSISPDPANGEVIQLDVLNDLVQQSVSHGVKICKRVGLQKTRQKNEERALETLPGKCSWAVY